VNLPHAAKPTIVPAPRIRRRGVTVRPLTNGMALQRAEEPAALS